MPSFDKWRRPESDIRKRSVVPMSCAWRPRNLHPNRRCPGCRVPPHRAHPPRPSPKIGVCRARVAPLSLSERRLLSVWSLRLSSLRGGRIRRRRPRPRTRPRAFSGGVPPPPRTAPAGGPLHTPNPTCSRGISRCTRHDQGWQPRQAQPARPRGRGPLPPAAARGRWRAQTQAQHPPRARPATTPSDALARPCHATPARVGPPAAQPSSTGCHVLWWPGLTRARGRAGPARGEAHTRQPARREQRRRCNRNDQTKLGGRRLSACAPPPHLRAPSGRGLVTAGGRAASPQAASPAATPARPAGRRPPGRGSGRGWRRPSPPRPPLPRALVTSPWPLSGGVPTRRLTPPTRFLRPRAALGGPSEPLRAWGGGAACGGLCPTTRRCGRHAWAADRRPRTGCPATGPTGSTQSMCGGGLPDSGADGGRHTGPLPAPLWLPCAVRRGRTEWLGHPTAAAAPPQSHSALMKSRVRFQGICNKAEPYCCSTPLRSERDRKWVHNSSLPNL